MGVSDDARGCLVFRRSVAIYGVGSFPNPKDGGRGWVETAVHDVDSTPVIHSSSALLWVITHVPTEILFVAFAQ